MTPTPASKIAGPMNAPRQPKRTSNLAASIVAMTPPTW